MKKFLLLLLLAFSLSTFGETATLTITGIMPVITEVKVVTNSSASTLPLNLGATDLEIAVVTEKSNKKVGYTVSVTSTNSGVLKNLGTSDEIAYTLKYDTIPIDLSAVSLVTNETKRTSSAGTPKSLTISFPASFIDDGSYTDIITFTIAAK